MTNYLNILKKLIRTLAQGRRLDKIMDMIKLPLMLTFIFVSWPSLAASLGDIEYPEFAVVPLASERLKIEAESERLGRWTRHLPIQVSALSTLIGALSSTGTSVVQPSNPLDAAPQPSVIGASVGGAWLAATLGLSLFYNPYGSGLEDLSKMPVKTESERLIKERMAEERIRSAAYVGKILKWSSFVSNQAACIVMTLQVRSGTMAQMANGLGIVLSFLPIIFDSGWEEVWDNHQKYQKRIYRPIAHMGFVGDGLSGDLSPSAFLTFRL